jgi:hypothetical protein
MDEQIKKTLLNLTIDVYDAVNGKEEEKEEEIKVEHKEEEIKVEHKANIQRKNVNKRYRKTRQGVAN